MKVLKKTGRFLWRYKFFSFAMIAALVALGLDLAGQDLAAHIILGTVSILAVLPLLKDMWEHLRSGGYGIDILAVTAIVTAVLLKEYWAAIIIVIMLTGGEALEDYAEHRAKAELDTLLTKAPQRATILRGRKTIEMPARDVEPGDKILLKPGEVVPVDAVILEGGGSFDEASITGESLPLMKETGDTLLSGSINLDGAITARCLRKAKDSQFEQIVKLVRAASNSQAPFVRLADRYAVPFTIFAYAIAGTVWAVSGDPMRFLEVIVVATPCPLLLAAPIAIISGMSRSAKHGIIIKNGGALERLAEARSIAFDKTGTLTLGQLEVDEIITLDPFSREDVLRAAASLEQLSNHAVASAITSAAAADGVRVAKVKSLKETAGQGLAGHFSGKEVRIGRIGYLETHGVDLPSRLPDVDETATYVAIGGKLAGVITFSDTVRDESKPTIERLRKLKFSRILMVTGDNKKNALAVAKQLGISAADVTAEALPADKLHVIERIKDNPKEQPVAFVGDGVNDAPVLTAANVGIALGARGSTVASESADIVIMPDDIGHVATAAAIADRTFRIARQSILIGIAISLLLMLAFATGRFTALTGALLQEVVDVIVIFNALRALRGKD
jgi:heavy metal translocating P-type ATPase